MVEGVRTLDSEEVRKGLFIPLEPFAGYEGIEIKVSEDGAVTIRPRKRRLSDICRTIASRREALKQRHGLMSDSSQMLRADRDSR